MSTDVALSSSQTSRETGAPVSWFTNRTSGRGRVRGEKKRAPRLVGRRVGQLTHRRFKLRSTMNGLFNEAAKAASRRSAGSWGSQVGIGRNAYVVRRPGTK